FGLVLRHSTTDPSSSRFGRGLNIECITVARLPVAPITPGGETLNGGFLWRVVGGRGLFVSGRNRSATFLIYSSRGTCRIWLLTLQSRGAEMRWAFVVAARAGSGRRK